LQSLLWVQPVPPPLALLLAPLDALLELLDDELLDDELLDDELELLDDELAPLPPMPVSPPMLVLPPALSEPPSLALPPNSAFSPEAHAPNTTAHTTPSPRKNENRPSRWSSSMANSHKRGTNPWKLVLHSTAPEPRDVRDLGPRTRTSCTGRLPLCQTGQPPG